MNKTVLFSFTLLFATATQAAPKKNVTFFRSIAGVLDEVCDQLVTFPEAVTAECKDGYSTVKDATEPARTKIKEKSIAFGAAVKKAAKRTGTAIKDVVEPVGMKVKDAVAVTGDVLVDLGGQFATFPADLVGECKDGYVAVKDAAVATKNSVKKVAKKTVVATKAFVNAFKDEEVIA